jgi:hypothetical protein
MNDPKTIRTPIHRLMGERRYPGDEHSLPSSQFEALRPLPLDVRPAVQEARDALRRRKSG